MLADTALTLASFKSAALGARVLCVLAGRSWYTTDRATVVATLARKGVCWLCF